MSTLLRRSKDRKTQTSPKIANAFGLPAGVSCPGATDFCTSCYAGRLEKAYTGVRNLAASNLAILKEATKKEIIRLLDEMVSAFEAECDKHKEPKLFRIHWDGDFFSIPYARAWAEVIKGHPDTGFWAYTRSFSRSKGNIDVVSIFRDLENLTLYLSADKDNWRTAKNKLEKEPWTKIAACGGTWAEAQEVMSKVGVKGPKCPVETKALPLVSQDGVGGCVACGLCIYGRNNVKFSVKKGV